MGSVFKVIVCPACQHEFKQESQFIVHAREKHGIIDFRSWYIQTILSGVEPRCQCSEDCQAPLRWENWKHGFVSRYARGHNARVDSCLKNPEVIKRATEKRIDGYRSGRYSVWNKGLTKETNQKIALMSEKIGQSLCEGYADGSITPWQQGLTKETDSRIAKMSTTRIDGFRTGRIVNWSQGLTKETDPRLARASAALSVAAVKAHRLDPKDVRSRVESSGRFELVSDPTEYRHRRIDRLTVRCTSCGHEQTKSLAMVEESPVCFRCHPKESKGQIELYEFVRSLAPDAVLSDRLVLEGQELDVYVPSRKFALEFNGLYWHSSKVISSTTYHDDKTHECSSLGIRLLHVFEDEWRDRRPIVESMIKNALGMSERGPGARECDLKHVSSAERRKFFSKSHLDGDSRCEVCLGLYGKDGGLLSALSLRRPFHQSRASRMEICRFATVLGTNVPGALGRLVKAALAEASSRGYSGLLSYADLRHGTGDSYMKVGFSDVTGKALPRFWWTDYVNRFNRFRYKADKTRGMTQAQVAEEAGVVMIWGCSNRVMVLDT